MNQNAIYRDHGYELLTDDAHHYEIRSIPGEMTNRRVYYPDLIPVVTADYVDVHLRWSSELMNQTFTLTDAVDLKNAMSEAISSARRIKNHIFDHESGLRREESI